MQAGIKNQMLVLSSLNEGMCPQVKGIQCTYDWSSVIIDIQNNINTAKYSIRQMQERNSTIEKEQNEVIAALTAYRQNFEAYTRKAGYYQQYKMLKDSLPTLPEEPEKPAQDWEEKRAALNTELAVSMARASMEKIRQEIPTKEATLKVLEALTSAFSKKGTDRNQWTSHTAQSETRRLQSF